MDLPNGHRMTTEPNENDRLIQRAQAGDRNAFAVIVEQHYERVLRVARNMTPTESDAEDVTQLAFIKLAKSIQQFRFEAAFTTWLYRLVINCSHDWRKSQARHQDEIDDEAAMDEPNRDQSEASIRLSEVMARIELMGVDYLETVALVVGEGLTHGEAAVTLGIKESTVSWRILEIRKQLSGY